MKSIVADSLSRLGEGTGHFCLLLTLLGGHSHFVRLFIQLYGRSFFAGFQIDRVKRFLGWLADIGGVAVNAQRRVRLLPFSWSLPRVNNVKASGDLAGARVNHVDLSVST